MTPPGWGATGASMRRGGHVEDHQDDAGGEGVHDARHGELRAVRPGLPDGGAVTVEEDQAARTATSWTMREGFEVQVAMYTRRDNRMIVLRHGTLDDGDAPFVRLHSACLTSEALGSTRCDCRDQLDEAIRRIGTEGMGILVYFPDHEGRGIGIEEKLAAYALQDRGHDTTQANVALGHPIDDRDFSAAADLLVEMGITAVRLMTNNPEKVRALEAGGITVERISAWVDSPSHASNYLDHKVQSMSHLA